MSDIILYSKVSQVGNLNVDFELAPKSCPFCGKRNNVKQNCGRESGKIELVSQNPVIPELETKLIGEDQPT